MELNEKLIDFRLKSTDDTYFDSKDVDLDKKLVVFLPVIIALMYMHTKRELSIYNKNILKHVFSLELIRMTIFDILRIISTK